MSEKIKCNQCPKMFTDASALMQHKEKTHPPLIGNTEEAQERIYQRSLEVAWQFLNAEEPDNNLQRAEQAARAYMGQYSRMKATAANREQNGLILARMLAGDDKEKLAEYIRLTNPSAPVLKALPAAQPN